jgi:DNA-binding beta-propeller fold protein YncE
MEVGAGIRRYEVVEDWPQVPEGMRWGQVVQVVVDSRDRVMFFQRVAPQVSIFDKSGEHLGNWESSRGFQDIHSVFVARDAEGEYMIVVDRDSNEVARTTLDGERVWSLKGSMFNRPTDAAVASNGDIYVTDGYGNAKLHRISARGELLQSWGAPGVAPGQFRLPHGVWVTARRGQEVVYVCDRENWRIQVFSLDGAYLGGKVAARRPTDIVADADGVRYVSELLHRVTILDNDDHVIARIGGAAAAHQPGQFVAPHSVWLDSEGSLYVTEVLQGQRVQKFRRVRGEG